VSRSARTRVSPIASLGGQKNRLVAEFFTRGGTGNIPPPRRRTLDPSRQGRATPAARPPPELPPQPVLSRTSAPNSARSLSLPAAAWPTARSPTAHPSHSVLPPHTRPAYPELDDLRLHAQAANNRGERAESAFGAALPAWVI